jgi:hypothetical protein
MRPYRVIIGSATLLLALYLSTTSIAEKASTLKAKRPIASTPSPSPANADPLKDDQKTETAIDTREKNGKGIAVDRPRVYDDARLQQMLQAAEARLATLQLIDQSQILAKLGAVTGASQQISSVGVNVQGAPLPGVVTTTKLPTQTTTTAPTGVTTVSGLATEDVQTTRPAQSPPTAVAPSPTTTLPSSGFSVSSSDILNEQMQLTAEINSLRLMLAGDLSSHFMKNNSEFGTGVTKLKTTLGFPITLSPMTLRDGGLYKDAVAVVEVEVSQPKKEEVIENAARFSVTQQALNSGDVPVKTEIDKAVANEAGDIDKVTRATEGPMVTTLLPREKTYNVATITDKSVSISGGVATQIVGFSGSWLRGHKTYYLVQDQDTVAKSFNPGSDNTVGFAWEFRPVLGQRFVKAGLRQTFVQLAFAVPSNAVEGEIGRITIRTYWRSYDRKRGIPKDIIPNSLTTYPAIEIPRYALSIQKPTLLFSNIEDIGGGAVQVNLKGKFLPGTYIRIGSRTIATPELIHEYDGIRFTTPVADAAFKDTFMVAHDGEEVPLTLDPCGLTFGADNTTRVTQYLIDGKPEVKALDDTNSLVTVKFNIQETVRGNGIRPTTTVKQPTRDIPGLVLVVGQRAFGYSQLKQDGNQLSVVVPSKVLDKRTELSIQSIFPERRCRTKGVAIGDAMPPAPERLVVLERNKATTTFLLFGTKLGNIDVLSPAGAKLDLIGDDPETLRKLTLTAGNLATNKQVLFKRPGGKPFLVNIPELEPKKPEAPKALESVTVGSDEAIVVGDGLGDVEAVTFRGKAVDFEVIDKSTLRIANLKGLLVTKSASTQTLTLQFKSGAKAKISLVVVDSKVELEKD